LPSDPALTARLAWGAAGKVQGVTSVDSKVDAGMGIRVVGNPASTRAGVHFELRRGIESPELLAIYTISGRCIRRIPLEDQRGEVFRVDWDGTDANGRNLASGVYFAVVSSGGNKAKVSFVLFR